MSTVPTATIAHISQLIVTQGGRSVAIPHAQSLAAPKKVVTISGTLNTWDRRVLVPKRTPTSPQPDPTVLWKWKQGMPFFQSLRVETSDPTGFVYLAILYDKPNSDSDKAPAGTHERWAHFALSCDDAFGLNTSEGLVHADPAIAVGTDADGFPSLLTDPGSVNGRVYEVQARASSTEADVYVDVAIHG